jgi:hypothetical protein
VHAAVFPLKAEGARFAAGLRLLGGMQQPVAAVHRAYRRRCVPPTPSPPMSSLLNYPLRKARSASCLLIERRGDAERS